MLISQKKIRNTVICNKLDESWGYHTKQNKPDQKQLRIIWSHSCMGYKTV